MWWLQSCVLVVPAAAVCQIDSWGTLKVTQLNSPHSTQFGSVSSMWRTDGSAAAAFQVLPLFFANAPCARAPRQMDMLGQFIRCISGKMNEAALIVLVLSYLISSPKKLYKHIWRCLLPIFAVWPADWCLVFVSCSCSNGSQHDLIFQRNVFVIILSLVSTYLFFFFLSLQLRCHKVFLASRFSNGICVWSCNMCCCLVQFYPGSRSDWQGLWGHGGAANRGRTTHRRALKWNQHARQSNQIRLWINVME